MDEQVMLSIKKTRDLLNEADKEGKLAILLLDRVSKEHETMKKLRIDTEQLVEEMTSNIAEENLRMQRLHEVVHADLRLLEQKRAELGVLMQKRKRASEELTELEAACHRDAGLVDCLDMMDPGLNNSRACPLPTCALPPQRAPQAQVHLRARLV